jgi:hypothetical protein
MIETIILSATSFILIAISIMEFASFAVYGKILNSAFYEDVIKIQSQKGVRLNGIDPSIINIGNLPYITTNFSLFNKWHITGIGRVWRWSKLSKLIDEIHKQAILNL